jgi:predicted nucleotidyltransferase
MKSQGLRDTMNFQEIKAFCAKIIREEFAAADVCIKQIILFGSQSHDGAKPDSDWDFLVCVNKELSYAEKTIISTKIQSRLAEKFISADVIVKSEAKLMQERGNVGVITYYALKDGVMV